MYSFLTYSSVRPLVSFINKKTNIVAILENTPNIIKVPPLPIALNKAGVTEPTIRVSVQLSSVPILTPLSFITSLIYNQTIGPGPNSKAITNRSVIANSNVPHELKAATPYIIRKTEQAPNHTNISDLLPYLSSIPTASITAPQLTPIIKAVA
jgi:hypothetical protein